MSGPLLLVALALLPAADPKPLADDGLEVARRTWTVGPAAAFDVVRFSPDGKRVVCLRILRVLNNDLRGPQISEPYLGEVWEFDRVLGKKIDPVKLKAGAYLRPVLSATGGLVAAQVPPAKRGQPLSVRVLTTRGTEAYRIDEYKGEDKLTLVAFSPADKYLVTYATGQKQVLVWDGKKGGKPTKFEWKEVPKADLLAGFSGDETRLVVYDPAAGKLEVYDPATGKEVAAHDLSKRIARPAVFNPLVTYDPRLGVPPAVSADGRYAILPTDALAGRYYEAVINLTTGAEVAFADGRALFAHFTSDGKSVTGFLPAVHSPEPGFRFGFDISGEGAMVLFGGYLLPAWPLLRNLGILVKLERYGFLPPILHATRLDRVVLAFPALNIPAVRLAAPKPVQKSVLKPARLVTKTLATGKEVTADLPAFDVVDRTLERRFCTDGQSVLDLETGVVLATPKPIQNPFLGPANPGDGRVFLPGLFDRNLGVRPGWVNPAGGLAFLPAADGKAMLVELPVNPPKPAAKPKQPFVAPPIPDRTTTKLMLFPLAPAAKK